MRVVLLRDCECGVAGQRMYLGWNEAIRLIDEGKARRLTWKEQITVK